MPRTYDEDGQPMMSNKAMLRMLVKEIPINDRRMANLEDRMDFLASDMTEVKSDLKKVKSDLKMLNIKTDQNHICLMTNAEDMEKRIRVLEAA